MFKLGRFAEAEAAYALAISQLPDSHLLLVPLLNNRGLSRLKTGNMSGAIEDCTAVIAIIGPSYHPAREAKVTLDEDGAGVDLGDGLIKAWRRRAEAYEGKEKWELARQDWESIAGADFAGRHRNEAPNGIGRCRRMQNVDNASNGAAPSASRANAPSSRPTATRPPPRPPRRGPTPPSEALTRLKQANQEAEAEEQTRLDLKDSVDSRLATWKNGKETNLRALVASLDTVLWPELGWQKVGMAELVTPNQVKIRYTKAIAKLHPDKVRTFV
jgi:tetratricopeptide (TPR) repeat protein